MNDNAHFLFFLFGMVGFFTCFLFSIPFFDIVTSLLYGSIGCLMIAIIGRKLLGFLITGLSIAVESTINYSHEKGSSENASLGVDKDAKNFTQDQV